MTAQSPERPAGSVDPQLLEILVCPGTKGPLEYDAEKQELISRSAKLAYPSRGGIPVMLPEEARRLDMALTAAPAQHLLVSVGRARALLGWSPGDSAERIAQTVRWCLEQPPDPLDRR
jgi:uncharacterized protein